jgi:hypothetical protein
MPRYLLVLILAVVIAGCVAGAATSGRVVLKDDNVAVDVRFSDHDRELVRDYYKPKKGKKGLPPGLAKRGGNLPPGLAKRDKLPPGLAGEALPRELDGKLSPLPANYVRVRIGQDIVLMDGKTRVVFDILYGADY